MRLRFALWKSFGQQDNEVDISGLRYRFRDPEHEMLFADVNVEVCLGREPLGYRCPEGDDLGAGEEEVLQCV